MDAVVTIRRFAINVLIFAVVILVMTALAIWLNLGPVASSAQSADELVAELRQFPPGLPATGPSNGIPDPKEERRQALYDRLWSLGPAALPALRRGLADPDVQVRRNVALFLGIAGGPWYRAGKASTRHPAMPGGVDCGPVRSRCASAAACRTGRGRNRRRGIVRCARAHYAARVGGRRVSQHRVHRSRRHRTRRPRGTASAAQGALGSERRGAPIRPAGNCCHR